MDGLASSNMDLCTPLIYNSLVCTCACIKIGIYMCGFIFICTYMEYVYMDVYAFVVFFFMCRKYGLRVCVKPCSNVIRKQKRKKLCQVFIAFVFKRP